MPDALSPLPQAEPIASQEKLERLELASRLYREYHTQCFWYARRDLLISEERIPFVIKGLRTYGGHRGFMLAGRLRGDWPPSRNVDEG